MNSPCFSFRCRRSEEFRLNVRLQMSQENVFGCRAVVSGCCSEDISENTWLRNNKNRQKSQNERNHVEYEQIYGLFM